MGACETAIEWGKQYGTTEEAWQVCERGDWMLWLVGKLSGKPETDSRKKLVLVACECTRLALPFVKKGELRPLIVLLAYAAHAADTAACAAPRRDILKQCAKIVRKYYPQPPQA